jgi:hypothetical protein
MAKKRGRPEAKSTRPPEGPKSSWPKDRRPPKAEKAKAPKSRAKEKPAAPTSMAAGVFRRFTSERLAVIAQDIVRKLGQLGAMEDQLRTEASESRANIKALKAGIEELRKQYTAGGEDAKQADLFAHEKPGATTASEPVANADAPTAAQVTTGLAAVAQRVEGGNGGLSAAVKDALANRPGPGYDFTPREPAPKIDQAKVDAVRSALPA